MKLKLTLAAIGVTLLTLLNAHSLNAQDSGFGTNRQPQTCPSKSAPTKGRISSKQAAIYAVCFTESGYQMRGTINFIDILSLEVAPKPRPVNGGDINTFGALDVSQPAYDLRGSAVEYVCYKINDTMYKPGRNCMVKRGPGTGRCVKNTFGEWLCSFGTASSYKGGDLFPPPN